MSHSLLHQEKRRRRATLKAKEGRILRNSPHKAATSGGALRHYHITERPLSPGWWARMGARVRSLFSLLSIGPDTRSIREKIHGGGWFRRQQKKEADKMNRRPHK